MALLSGRLSPTLSARSLASPLSFAACSAMNHASWSRSIMSSLSVSSTRLLAPVCANTSVIILRSSPSASASPSPSARAAVLMFITMLTRALTCAALPISPV